MRRPAWQDDRAVSEVVGYILTFGILSMILIISMMSFNIARESAVDRAVLTTSQSIAERVKAQVFSAAQFAEEFADQQVQLQTNLALPQAIEGRSYTMAITGGDSVVTVPRHGYVSTSPLLNVGQGPVVFICEATGLPGGSISVFIIPEADIALRCNGAAPPVVSQFYVVIESFEE
jgi:hypothetical protein